ncbi:DNA starvation/stationary phase protection protein [Streptomyces werraensis]|uniref:DNA starvation/stationary phase protection protein n=1 Tax=Streptomyces werraensis TaxID=68284 RepID=A0ABV3JMU6_9ACTN
MSPIIQEFGTVSEVPIGLAAETREYSCQQLSRILADTQMLHALYKKYHWLVRGSTFYQLHQLLDEHAGAQLRLVDALAERIQTLGGVAVGDPRHAAELTNVPRPPDGVEEVPAMLWRLLQAHELTLATARTAAARTAELGDDGTNDLLVSEVIRTGEAQCWFLCAQLVNTPLVPTEPVDR